MGEAGGSRWTSISESNLNLDPEGSSLDKKRPAFIPEFDRFLVSFGEKIAEGGQGQVFKAKLYLPYSFKPVSVVVKRFKKFGGVSQGQFPIELVNSMKTYSVCAPIGMFYDGDSLCLMLRWYSCDLRGAIDSRMEALGDDLLGSNVSPFSEDGGNSIIFQLAMALKALHENGIYQRDLKADNILIRARGKNYDMSPTCPVHVALADFERSEDVVGTAFFRAPEVLRSLDMRVPLSNRVPLSKEEWLLADIYSFGMVCYEVLTGKYPFEGRPESDYDLVLTGGRPELPMHLSPTWRDLILRCWDADPQSRPGWDEIIAASSHRVGYGFVDYMSDLSFVNYVSNSARLELLSLESLVDEAKDMIRMETFYERDVELFGMGFMAFYWASEFVATAEKCVSKFEVVSFGGESPICGYLGTFERMKLISMLRSQMFGFLYNSVAVSDLYWEEDETLGGLARKSVLHMELLTSVVKALHSNLCLILGKVDSRNEFEVGTSWIAKLSFYHALATWTLWYEHADIGLLHGLIESILLPTECSWEDVFQSALLIFCLLGNAYIYVLAMITYEPLLLGVQYGLYKIMGSKNIFYRSFGERICRFQRAWMNSTRLWTKSKGLGITLLVLFIILCGVYGWKGILGWIVLPSYLMYGVHWRHPIRLG